MSALSTPGGGGTTAQTKPTSGKTKFQKLDINSLYCANKNENSEPSSVKSQLSRKHGMQILGKVPSARRPPANLPSLKTETGQDTNANPISSTTTTTTPAPPTCTSQTTTTPASSGVVAGTGPGGWVPLPPPSSSHFRTEFPSLEAAAQPLHRSGEPQSQPSLRPQTEGSWTCGGTAGVRQDQTSSPAPLSSVPSPQIPALRAILPSFLMKGSSSGGALGLGSLGGMREGGRSGNSGGGGGGGRSAPRPAPATRAQEVLTARPILRDDQISSLDDVARDSGWAHQDDIDYDQKLDFSDEPNAKSSHKSNKNNNRTGIDNDRLDNKIHETGDEDQIWAERRQKHNNEVAAAVVRARQRKEEEQKRQLRDAQPNQPKDRDNENRDSDRRDRDRSASRERHRPDIREKERIDPRDRDNRDKERIDPKEIERIDNKDRFENRERHDSRGDNREGRGRVEGRDRERLDNVEKERDRNDNRDRFDRDRDRDDRERDRDFRDRDYGRERDAPNAGFSKNFQANIPPRFLKKQQGRQQEDPHKSNWAFPGKPAPRRQDPPQQYNTQRHVPPSGRRSYSRDYSDREDDFRRDKDSGHQWRSEMHDYDRSGRDLDRQSSKESYKDYSDHKDRRSDTGRRSVDNAAEQHSRTSAADKLTEVFERKSIGVAEPFAPNESAPQPVSVAERRRTPPSNSSRRESSERDIGKTPWVETSHEEQTFTVLKPTQDKITIQKRDHTENSNKDLEQSENDKKPAIQASNQNLYVNKVPSVQGSNKFVDNSKPMHVPLARSGSQVDPIITHKPPTEHSPQIAVKPYISQKSEKDFSESESIASKSSTDRPGGAKINQTPSIESLQSSGVDNQKRSSISVDDKKLEKSETVNKTQSKETIERKSSGSGSEKKGRGGGFAVYNTRGWGQRESRGRRSHRSSRSNRASESDGSTDGAPNHERKDRIRRAPRSPRGPKKPEESLRNNMPEQSITAPDCVENREPFAPRGQPSRRGRGGFQGASRPPAPAKRVTGYGPPNTKSPFSQANRAAKDGEDIKEGVIVDDKSKAGYKQRVSVPNAKGDGRGRDRRPKGALGVPSGEDENWETTSEHSEGGQGSHMRSIGSRPQRGQSGRPQNVGRQNNRNMSGGKKEGVEGKSNDVVEAMADLKISKNDEIIDDGFQEVRNKKPPKDTRVPGKEENNQAFKGQRSQSSQGSGRNGSSTRPANEKPNVRGPAPISNKPGPQYERQQRQLNLPPRLAKQRQKQQMGLLSGFGPDTGAAPPPPPVNAWDKPIAQSLRANVEEANVDIDDKLIQHAIKSSAGENPVEPKAAIVAPCNLSADKAGVLDGTTPPMETIIFENTNYKTTPPVEALKQKYQPGVNIKSQNEDMTEKDNRMLTYNGEVRPPPRLIQELIADSGRSANDADPSMGLQMSFETAQKGEDSSDMKLDFAFDSDLGHLTEDKSVKSLGLPRSTPMSVSNTISPLAADLNFKIASVKKVWEMPAVAEGGGGSGAAGGGGGEELQFSGFEEGGGGGGEAGAPPNVCKVKPTQQLQSPPPQHYSHVGYGGYGPLSVPSPPAVLFNSSQQLLGSSQQGSLYGAFLDQSRGQFGGFPGAPYAPSAAAATPYNYQPPDMFQPIPNQFRMTAAAAAGGGGGFGQSQQLGNNPSTVLISSTSNSLMSATVKPSSQQIGAIGSKGSVGGYGAQYLGYSAPVGEGYSLAGVAGVAGLLPRAAPPASSYYAPYQPNAAPPPPTYPLQFQQPAPQNAAAFSSQYLSSQHLSSQHMSSQHISSQHLSSQHLSSQHISSQQLQVAAAAAAVQQMQQQQYRGPMQQQQQQYAPRQQQPPQQQQQPQQQQLKSPLHEQHANGFAGLCDGGNGGSQGAGSPTPKGKLASPPQHTVSHKFQPHVPPPHHPQSHHGPHLAHHAPPHHHHPHQGMVGNNSRGGNGNGGQQQQQRGNMAPRYPSPIQRPLAPAPTAYRAAPAHQQHQQPQHRHAHNAHQHHNPHAHHPHRPPAAYHYQNQRQNAGGGGAGGVGGGGAVSSAGGAEPAVEVANGAEAPEGDNPAPDAGDAKAE